MFNNLPFVLPFTFTKLLILSLISLGDKAIKGAHTNLTQPIPLNDIWRGQLAIRVTSEYDVIVFKLFIYEEAVFCYDWDALNVCF